MDNLITIINKIFNRKVKFLCVHKNIKTVYLIDKIYDDITDNDDLEDSPTFIKIKYCTDCGKIIEMCHTFSTPIKYKTMALCRFINVSRESSYSDILEFERITKLKHEKITLYKK